MISFLKVKIGIEMPKKGVRTCLIIVANIFSFKSIIIKKFLRRSLIEKKSIRTEKKRIILFLWGPDSNFSITLKSFIVNRSALIPRK